MTNTPRVTDEMRRKAIEDHQPLRRIEINTVLGVCQAEAEAAQPGETITDIAARLADKLHQQFGVRADRDLPSKQVYEDTAEDLDRAAHRLRQVYSDLTHTLTKLTEIGDDGTYTEPLSQAMRELNTLANVIGDIDR